MAEPEHAVPDGKSSMLEEVRAGLRQPQKELSAKYFYDERGSDLFEQVTGLPEYYLSRTERALLEAHAPELVGSLRPRALVELGPGSARKTRILLDAMRELGQGAVYVPVDVSSRFLDEVAGSLRVEYPELRIEPVEADIAASLELPPGLAHPALFALLGSTIGNFPGDAATRVLRRVRSAMRTRDRFLMGADLKKDPARIEAAYNDSQGVTEKFNQNILHVLNRELGADFDVNAFQHRALYNAKAGQVEMYLVSQRDQIVNIPGIGAIGFRQGEHMRTAVSRKFDREDIGRLFGSAGMKLDGWWTDRQGLYALALAAS